MVKGERNTTHRPQVKSPELANLRRKAIPRDEVRGNDGHYSSHGWRFGTLIREQASLKVLVIPQKSPPITGHPFTAH